MTERAMRKEQKTVSLKNAGLVNLQKTTTKKDPCGDLKHLTVYMKDLDK